MSDKKVFYWPNGYADENGTKWVRCAEDANFSDEVRKHSGSPSAKVAYVINVNPFATSKKFPSEYIREMSVGG